MATKCRSLHRAIRGRKRRVGIGKKLRFEVFKRDSFTCQYCGAKAPDVLLEADHVQPRSKGGSDDILNLVTACEACNRGKGARELSDAAALEKKRTQLEALQERRDQIEMMVHWQRGLMNLDDLTVEEVASFFSEVMGGFILNESGRAGAKRLVKKFGLAEVLEAIRIAGDAYLRYDPQGDPTPESVEHAWDKVGGICWNRRQDSTDPEAANWRRARTSFVNAYRETCSGWPEDWALRKWWGECAEAYLRLNPEIDPQFAARFITELCREEYQSGDHSSYRSALEGLSDSWFDIWWERHGPK